MKKLLVAGIAAAALYGAPALAGPPPSVFNWSGFYIGVNGGGMDYKTEGTFSPGTPAAFFGTSRKEVGIGGIHGGYQAQWGNLVVGIEGAWQGMLGDQYATTLGTLGVAPPCGLFAGASCQARINDILSVGPRVGLAMGQWMVYGTGGFARAMIDSRIFNPVSAVSTNHNDGWYYGGGLEMLVTNGFVVGLEYRHYGFNSALQGHNAFSPAADRNLKATADAALLRLTIKQ